MATKIVTKNSSTAGAAPTATDLVQGELAVNVADGRLYTEDNAAAIVELGVNPATEITANAGIALPDSQKATFGAGDDLQIYHDGSNSIIHETAAGSLLFRGTNLSLQSDANVNYLQAVADGAVTLYHQNGGAAAPKLATTSTGIDVTGNMIADGVGIGTSSPDFSLSVGNDSDSSNYVSVRASNTGSSGYLFSDAQDADVGYVNYSHATNHMGFGANGSERMRIDSSGNVGIGCTPSPWFGSKALEFGFYGSISADSVGSKFGTNIAQNAYASSEGVEPSPWKYITSNANARPSLYQQYDGGHYFSTAATGTAGNAISWSTPMTIDSSGNVGIGISPVEQLHLGGRTHPVFELQANSTSGTGRINFSDTTVRGQILYDHTNDSMRLLTAAAERMRIDSSGNLLLNTTNSPTTTKAIISSDYSAAGTTNTGLTITGRQSGNWYNNGIHALGASGLVFSTGTTGTNGADASNERMRIDASGHVGIGKTPLGNNLSPALEMVSGGTMFGYGDAMYLTGNLYYNNGWKAIATGAGASMVLDASGPKFYTNASASAGGAVSPTERMRIDASGATLVNTTAKTNTGTRLGVWADSGSVSIETRCKANVSYFPLANYSAAGSYIGGVNATTTATSLATSSDERLKENIADANDTGSKIDAIQVRQFDWKADGSHQDYGMIAQELREVIPHAVHESPDEEKMLAVDYAGLVPMLIKEIQSLRNRVAQLETGE